MNKTNVNEIKKQTENQPEMKFRAGAVCATVWSNKVADKEGAEFHTISLERSYVDKEGKWQSTTGMRINDLPRANVVLQKAYEYLVLADSERTKEHA